MFDLSVIGRQVANAPTGAARGPQGSAAASVDAAATETFGDALAFLAAFDGVIVEDAGAAPGDGVGDEPVMADREGDAADLDEINAAAAAAFINGVQPANPSDWTVGDAAGAPALDAESSTSDEPVTTDERATAMPTGAVPVASRADLPATQSATPLTSTPAPSAATSSSVDEGAAAPAQVPKQQNAHDTKHAPEPVRAEAIPAQAAPVTAAAKPETEKAQTSGAVIDPQAIGRAVSRGATPSTDAARQVPAHVVRMAHKLRAAIEPVTSERDEVVAAAFAPPQVRADAPVAPPAVEMPAPTQTFLPAGAALHVIERAAATSETHDGSMNFGAGSHSLTPRASVVSPATAVSFAPLVTATPDAGILPPETSAQIVQAIRMQFGRNGSEAHIKLDPQQFGEVSVRIRVEQGQVVARVEADTPVVREWLQSNQHVLRQNLAGQQLTLDRLEVSEPRASSDRDNEREPGRREEAPHERRQRRRQPSGELFDVSA